MAAIAQTIMIVDKSNKVVGTSKQLKNVFKEAKMAYMEKKADIAAERAKKEERELQKAIKAMSIAESESGRSDRPRQHRSSSHRDYDREHRPDLQIRPSNNRHYSGSSVHSSRSRRSSLSPRSPRSPSGHHSPVYRSPTYTDYEEPPAYNTPVIPSSHHQETALTRAHTDLDLAHLPSRPRNLSRAHTTSAVDIDMDLAYGEYHPHLDPLSPVHNREVAVVQKEELSSLVLKCKMLMDEANCAQHSVKAIVSHLQKNPDAMAALALTLAEISNIASKMAPGALAAFKVGAPSVFALLAAPEFLIAVGVSVGITVVMFGGYKIMKKIKAARAGDESPGVDEAIDVDELSHIDQWRRGIADSAFDPNDDDDMRTVVSNGTSVEGEFITPIAARSLGHLPDTMRGEKARKERKSKKEGKEESKKSKKSKSVSSKGSSRLALGGERAVVKVKKPSPLRRMFNRDERSSVAS